MPIRIPKMQRRAIAQGSPGSATKGFGPDFVPPHLLEVKDSDVSDPGLIFSPASVKREKLVARNAILRSTGFIEVQSFTAPTGEIIDAVKESVMDNPNVSPKAGIRIARTISSDRPAPLSSSLTALLGKSK